MILSTALLAGGRSSRMGEDKAFLDWKGRPLWAHQLAKLLELQPAGPALLSANPGQPFPAFIEGVRLVHDSASGLGPLGALRDCLAAAGAADYLLVLAVDLPGMPGESLRVLSRFPSLTRRGAIPKLDGRWEPLAAIYPLAALAFAEEQIARGQLSLQALCDRLETAGLVDGMPVEPENRGHYANVNTPEDYALVQQGQFDRPTLLRRFAAGKGFARASDRLAAEDPLEIRVEGRSIAVVMRTPGHDEELAAGFLFTESAIASRDDLFEIARCPGIEPEAEGNVLDVALAPGHAADLDALTRHVFTSSSCGVCGKATIESVFGSFPPVESPLVLEPELLLSLPDKLRQAQATFEKTGGLHASALFDSKGELLLLREDVGRHNALDKVVGRALLDGDLPLAGRVLLLSGRVSFELIQKALAAGIPVVAGISAPSSLAVEFARRSGQTLVGFLRERGFNLYAGFQRVAG